VNGCKEKGNDGVRGAVVGEAEEKGGVEGSSRKKWKKKKKGKRRL